MIRYLLDTNICIDLIRHRPSLVLARLRRRRIGTIGLSAVTLAELHDGVARSRDPERNAIALAHFCAPLVVCPFDADAAAAHGTVRRGLEQTGQPIGPLDTLIAAHALAIGATVITANEREFRRVRGLRVENWST
ncbi:MAG: type II toxin-antitoxin system VapC family toxin [Phycisphaerales bacterium]|nr:type II toxin-antitoxin system VapC family toxin [Phycisphaerales bacterium]